MQQIAYLTHVKTPFLNNDPRPCRSDTNTLGQVSVELVSDYLTTSHSPWRDSFWTWGRVHLAVCGLASNSYRVGAVASEAGRLVAERFPECLHGLVAT